MPSTVDLLEKIALLTVLPEDILARLPERMTERKFAQGDMLFHKGDPGGTMLLILDGLVAIILEHDDGNQEILNQLGLGEALGQMSLIEPSARTAAATAVSPVTALELKAEDFQAIIDGQPEAVMEALKTVSHQMRLGYLDILKETRIFSGLPEDIVSSIARKLTVEHLQNDQSLFHKGEAGDSLYIIDEGALKIVTTDAAGGELVLNNVGAGDSIGEMSLIDEEPRSASVIATMPTTLLKLSRGDFMAAIQDQPTIALEVMKNISGRLRFATTYIEQAIEWSKKIAVGDYSFALNQIETSQSTVARGQQANEARATELLAAFFQMVRGVQEREESLKQQLRQLTIEIDEVKRKQEVQNLTGSEFFSDLKKQAQRLREQRDEDE
jgi:CRP-like cAMP-binding protein